MWTAPSNWIWTACCSYDCHQTKRTNASFRDPGVLFFLVTRHPWDLTQHRKPTHGAWIGISLLYSYLPAHSAQGGEGSVHAVWG